MGSMKKLAKKVKVIGGSDHHKPPQYECLLREGEGHESPSSTTPIGFFAIYVGEERQRFVVPTSYLSHPLFKMLLEKASDEYGYDQKEGLVVPCSVSTFQEVVSAVECCNGKFQFGDFIEELI
ncbi:Small auxin-up RNA [Dillenia turbinata]|uniref:Small auxin-up RNA n=1 Tax=Dillenia turbinata TaxID=194707 RepID=A0AAN8ZSL3_9MAGN